MTHIWWIRRDLRLYDNPALNAALQGKNTLLPVFILDPGLLSSAYVGEKRLAFLFRGLQDLDRALQDRGGRLFCFQGDPREVLHRLVDQFPGAQVFAQEDFSPYARSRDKRVAAAVDLTLTPGVTAMHPAAVLKSNGEPYTVFTPFSRTWKAQHAPARLLPAPEQISVPEGVQSDPLPLPEDFEALPRFPRRRIRSPTPAGDLYKRSGRARLWLQ